MSVYKDGAFWRADVYFRGKRVKVKKGFFSKREAKAWHDDAFLKYVPDVKPQEKVLFSAIINLFEEFHLPKIAASTRRRYMQDIEIRIRPLMGHIAIADIAPIFLEKIVQKIFASLTVKTANNCVGLLKTIFNQGARWGMINSELMKHIQMRKIHRKPYTWWQNKEDIMKFLEVAKDDRYYLAYRLGLECGMRIGEIVGLTKSAVDLKNCFIHIHQQWQEKEKKYAPPKHGKMRYIRFQRDSELYTLLEHAVMLNPKEERMFLTPEGKIVNANHLSCTFFQRLIEKSGVPRIRFHDLRHTFASWYMMMGGSIWDLKGILGHSDIATTQKYAHLSKHGVEVPELFTVDRKIE